MIFVLIGLIQSFGLLFYCLSCILFHAFGGVVIGGFRINWGLKIVNFDKMAYFSNFRPHSIRFTGEIRHITLNYLLRTNRRDIFDSDKKKSVNYLDQNFFSEFLNLGSES